MKNTEFYAMAPFKVPNTFYATMAVDRCMTVAFRSPFFSQRSVIRNIS